MPMPPNKDQQPIPDAEEVGTIRVLFDGPEARPGMRSIPVETPVNVVYGGVPFAVMMATPRDLEDFAVGFSLTEGIIASPDDIRQVRIATEERGLRLDVDLTYERLHEHLARKRALLGRTGCGLCGISDLEALPKARAPLEIATQVSVSAVHKALLMLERHQPLNEASHAVHAAAWADLDGNIRAVREDVGRHNALDKLIGALCIAETDLKSGFVVVTSRCSFELVEKVAAFGAPMLVAISAPTTLALERARHYGMTLVGIARHDSITIFHGGERIRAQDTST